MSREGELMWKEMSMNQHEPVLQFQGKCNLTATLPSRWWPVSGHARCVHSWPTVRQATNSLRIRITPILGIGPPNNKLHHPLTSRPKTGGKRSSQGGRGLESKIQFFRLRQCHNTACSNSLSSMQTFFYLMQIGGPWTKSGWGCLKKTKKPCGLSNPNSCRVNLRLPLESHFFMVTVSSHLLPNPHFWLPFPTIFHDVKIW